MNTPPSLSGSTAGRSIPETLDAQLALVRAEAAARYQQARSGTIETNNIVFNIATPERRELLSAQSGLAQQQIQQEILPSVSSSLNAHAAQYEESTDSLNGGTLKFSTSETMAGYLVNSNAAQLRKIELQLESACRQSESLNNQIGQNHFPSSREISELTDTVSDVNEGIIRLLERITPSSPGIAQRLAQYQDTLENHGGMISASMGHLPRPNEMPSRESFQVPLTTIRSALDEIQAAMSFLNGLVTSEIPANQSAGAIDEHRLSGSSISSLTDDFSSDSSRRNSDTKNAYDADAEISDSSHQGLTADTASADEAISAQAQPINQEQGLHPANNDEEEEYPDDFEEDSGYTDGEPANHLPVQMIAHGNQAAADSETTYSSNFELDSNNTNTDAGV